MTNILYVLVALFVVFYGGILIVVNRLPNVSVKSLGLLSLKGITVETPTKNIRIRQLRLRVNLFRGRDSPLKLFNLEIFNSEIEILGSDSSHHEKTTKASSPVDIEKLLQFVISKRVYDLIFYYQLLNQIHIIFYRCSIHHLGVDKNSKLHFDYAKLENLLRYDGHNSLTLLMFNGFLHELEDHERIQIFRNIEINFTCDAVFSCNVTSSDLMETKLTNFSLNVALGKAHIPVDHMHIRKPVKSDHDESRHPISKNDIQFLREFWKVFDEAKLTLEDFTITLGPYNLQVATFQTSIVHNKVLETMNESVADFNFHVTSLKIFEADTKCFELPATACNLEANPFGILQGIENTHNSELIRDCLSLNLKFNLIVTNPSFDIYHDQVVRFKMNRKKEPSASNFLDNINVNNFLMALRYVSTKIVIVDTKLVAHVPGFGIKEFHRGAALNLTTVFTIDSIVSRFATKDLSGALSGEKEKSQYLYGLFKVKNFKCNLLDNVLYFSKFNILATYNIKDKDISLKVNSKKANLRSINSAIFHFGREIQTRRILLDNKLYDNLIDKEPIIPTDTDSDVYYDLFKILPPIIKKVKFECHDIHLDIICNDGLPSLIYVDEETKQEYDLKDYGRGVSLKLGHVSCHYKKDNEEVNATFRNLQCFTLSELDLDYTADFDVVALLSNNKDDFSDVSSLESIALAERDEDDLRQVKKVLFIDEIEINNYSNKQRDRNRLTITIPEVDGRCDIFLMWCTIYAVSLIKAFSPKIVRNCPKNEIRHLMGKGNKKLKLDVSITAITIVTRLPNRVDVLSEFDTLHFRDVFESKSVEFKYFRSYVVHPITKLWSRFLTMKNSFISMEHSLEDQELLDVVCRGVRLNIPHGFLFYTVIDNIVTFAKAIKQINHNFGLISESPDNNDFSALPQTARDALKMPTVNIKSEVFGMTLENDPFENELSYIFELGMIEQRYRIKKQIMFDAKAKEIAENTIELKIELSNVDAHPPVKGSADNAYPSIDGNVLMSNEEASKKIEAARYELESEFSASWIFKFKKFRSIKIKNWKARADRSWGTDKISSRMTEKFDIMNYSSGPLLMGGLFKNLDLTVSETTILDIDKFLYDFGKGQPKLQYSILAPFHLLIKSSCVFIFLKDYPLPLLSFPDNDNPNRPAFHLEGNIIVNEKLVHRKEELRQIWVPFSPPSAPESEADSFYAVNVTRTLTPVKFMVDLKCKIDSDRAVMLSWSKSYQAGILAAMTAVDNFTKPKIDDSPLGWWDKVALLLHGKITFDIPNELCLHIKSSTSPYELTGKNSGFVFCWKNNVQLQINGMDSKKLVLLESDDFLLAIPNHSVTEKRSWSLFYDEFSEDVPDIESEAKKYLKKVMVLSSDEKVKWTLGFLFERNSDNSGLLGDHQERTNDFKHHYDVVVTSPYFDWHPDSYEGYRSDYLHLAISVKSVSAKGNASNNVHFTPLTFKYFFFWWNTITEAISLPIRQGRLFSNDVVDTSHVKMSSHLFTVKYQLILEPLTISHMISHSSGATDSKIAFTGLKSKVGRCVIDLHQRKELLTYVNKKLNIENQILHLKMHQAEITFADSDVRMVNAVFPEKSRQFQLAKYLDGSVTDSSSGETDSRWGHSLEISVSDISWLDHEDFIELETREVLSPYPHVIALPFSYSPRFTYIREFSLQEEGNYPFGREDVHDCELNTEKPEDTQSIIMGNRLRSIASEIQANVDLLATLTKSNPEDGNIGYEILKIKSTIKELNSKRDLLETVYEDLVGVADSVYDTSSADITRHNSRLSVYSGHKSLEEAKSLGLLHKEVSEFHNRFIVHNLQLKWGNDIRNYFMNYVQLVSDSSSEAYFMSKKAVDLVESVINNVPDEFKTEPGDEDFCEECRAGEDVIRDFDEYLDDVNQNTQEADHKFLVKLIHPQIQLVSDKDKESAALVVSKDLEMRIISINVKGVSTLVNADNEVSGLIESRYGGLFNGSSIYIFRKEDAVMTTTDIPYGYDGAQLAISWPPWLETEHFYDGCWLKQNLIAENLSMGLTFKKPNYLSMDTSSVEKNEIIVHVGKFVITADSHQYSTLFYVISDLLVYGKTLRDTFMNRLDKVVALADNNDFYGLDERVKDLQYCIRHYHEVLLKLDSKAIKLNDSGKSEALLLEMELERKKLELSMIMRGLKLRNTKSSNKRVARSWLVAVDQIIWHFLDSNRSPFIDLALAGSQFARIDSMDGSNKNKVVVNMIQGFNLQEKAVYPELLSPFNENKDGKNPPIILMTWKMLHPVGGIPIMQHAKVNVEPIKIQLDYKTSKMLFDYAFPTPDVKEPESDTTKSPGSEKAEVGSDISSFDMALPLERPKGIFKNFVKKASPTSVTDDEAESVSLISTPQSESTKFSSSEDLTGGEGNSRSSKEFKIPVIGKKKANREEEYDDDIALIVSRSSKFISIVDIEVQHTKLLISFKAPKHLNIIDVHNLMINFPSIRYQNKTWSGQDFILRLRKDVIKIILQHTGQIIGNKLKIKKRKLLKEPLKQISNYASFISVQDLQNNNGSSNDSNESSRTPHHQSHHNHQFYYHRPRIGSSSSQGSSSSLPEETSNSKKPRNVAFESILQEIIDEDETEDELVSTSTDKV